MTRFLTLSLAVLLSQAALDAKSSEIDRALADRIVQAGMQRVAVLPIPIHRDGNEETLGSPELGPMGPWVADVLSEGLTKRSDGRFRVVSNRQMNDALRKSKFMLDDLGSLEKLKELSDAVNGIDGLVVGRVVDEKFPSDPPGPLAGKVRQSQITFNVVDVKTGDLVGSENDEIPINTTLAVYRGGSSTRRDFQNAGLGSKAPNFVDDTAAQAAPPRGTPRAPNLPAPTPDQPAPAPVAAPVPAPAPSAPNIPPPVATPVVTPNGHPLRDPNLAIKFNVKVAEEIRALQFVTDPKTGVEQCWVAIEPGEKYILRIEKQYPRALYLAATVDGLNSLTKTRDLEKCWFLREGARTSYIDGWSVKQGSTYRQEEFVVSPAQDSVAYTVQGGSPEQIGQISFMIYPVAGEEKGFKPQGAKAMSPSADNPWGTGSGQGTDTVLSEYAGAPPRSTHGIGVTIFYAPASVIARKTSVTQ